MSGRNCLLTLDGRVVRSPIEVDLSGVEETKAHEVPLSQRDSGNLLINRKYAMQYV